MKKKNLVAMGLAGVMLVGGCVPVLAASSDPIVIAPSDGSTSGAPNSNNAYVGVEITEPIKYTVSIPAEFTTNDSGTSLQISVGEVFNIEPSASVKVSVDDPDITLLNENNNSAVWNKVMKVDDIKFTTISMNNDSHENKIISLENAENEPNTHAAGKYKKNITFSIAYDDGKAAS